MIKEKWRVWKKKKRKRLARKLSTSSGKAEENLVTYFGLTARLEASLEFPQVSAEVHPPTRAAICCRKMYLLFFFLFSKRK